MGAESALLGSLITSLTGLCGMIIAKVKCVYRRTEDGCQPACACSGQPLEHQEEDIEVRRFELEGKEVALIIKTTK